LRKPIEKFHVSLKPDKNYGYYTRIHMYIYGNIAPIVLKTTNVSDKRCRGNQNTHFVSNNIFMKIVPFINNVEKYGRDRQVADNIIRSMRIACRVTKVTDTRSEYIIFTAFPQQQWLCERAKMLCYAYTDCSVLILLDKLCRLIHINYKTSTRNTRRNARSFKRTPSHQAVWHQNTLQHTSQ
jgi:hypothetical protein